MMLHLRSRPGFFPACLLLAAVLVAPRAVLAWGDEGHRIIGLIAEHYLDPAVRAKVATLLAADTDTLRRHDIASEATWADKYRDSDRHTTKIRYEATRQWHFVDIELSLPDLAAACFGHPPLGRDDDHRQARRLAVEETARDRQIGAGQYEQRPDRTDRDDGKKRGCAIGKSGGEQQQCGAENDRRQSGSRTETVLSLQPAGSMTHRQRSERTQQQVCEAR
jgi:hypothetical protein